MGDIEELISRVEDCRDDTFLNFLFCRGGDALDIKFADSLADEFCLTEDEFLEAVDRADRDEVIAWVDVRG